MSAPALDVTVNGTPRRLDAGTTVAQLVVAENGNGRGVAVAVNAEVVPRSAWGHTALAAGDQIELLSPAQGG